VVNAEPGPTFVALGGRDSRNQNNFVIESNFCSADGLNKGQLGEEVAGFNSAFVSLNDDTSGLHQFVSFGDDE
jgi:hypothetical protein